MYALCSPLLALGIPSLEGIGKILVFLVMLSILVVLHEYGHFLMARRAGVRVNDFAVGFGPTLLKWTSPRSGTNYRLNLLPIGGYCAMQGEDGKTSEAEQQRLFRENASVASGSSQVGVAPLLGSSTAFASVATAAPSYPTVYVGGSTGALDYAAPTVVDNFQSKTAAARLSIVVAGPIANFILAYVIIFVSAITFGVASSSISPQIAFPIPDSPAVRAGLQAGDVITAIDGKTIGSGNAMVDTIHASIGKTLRITVARGSESLTLPVVPKATKIGDKTVGTIGFHPISVFKRVGFFNAFAVAGTSFGDMLVGQVQSYGALFTHFKQNAGNLSGVIGMGREAAMVQDLGWGPYFTMAAMISIALGLLNLLPFPALDGGRAVFILAEMLRGKPVEPEKEALVHVTGLAVLMALMVVIAYHDIANIISGKGVF